MQENVRFLHELKLRKLQEVKTSKSCKILQGDFTQCKILASWVVIVVILLLSALCHVMCNNIPKKYSDVTTLVLIVRWHLCLVVCYSITTEIFTIYMLETKFTHIWIKSGCVKFVCINVLLQYLIMKESEII